MKDKHVEFFRKKALSAGAAAAMLMSGVDAHAADTVKLTPDPARAFGAVGVTQWDGIRVSATDITGDGKLVAADGDGKSRSCSVGFVLVDADGSVLKQTAMTLGAGKTVSLEISGQEIRSRVSVDQARSARVMVRPVVLLPPDPCKVAPSVEVVDNATGRTLFALPAVQK